MTEDPHKKDLLLSTHARLIDAIMCRTPDPEGDLRSIMAPAIQGYGTGQHEGFSSCEEYIEKISRVFSRQLPGDVQYGYQELHTILEGDTAVVHGPFVIRYGLDGQAYESQYRRSVVFQWTGDRWQAVHLHASEPSAHLVAGESWPAEALKAQNEALKQQVAERTRELSQSLENLKAAQKQLVQSEKMASLGELTAGIAHEIQNPLNFINNFSEVSSELVQELKEELGAGNTDNAMTIGGDLEQNLQKVVHHGHRADSIVKSMLQHARSSSGQKEPTDINALADEFFRLSYHGLRARDKSFNAACHSELDKSVGKIAVVPQDIGRVLLNVFNNAFYAVAQKKKAAGAGYEPVVQLKTERRGNTLLICIKDNGTGMPQPVVEKIYQPFFTTKPTGEGTGLGLSISYDIITQGHGGKLEVSSQEGEGTEFRITLPVSE